MKVSPRSTPLHEARVGDPGAWGSTLLCKLSHPYSFAFARLGGGLDSVAPAALGTGFLREFRPCLIGLVCGGKSLRLMVDSWIYVLKSRPYTPWPAELHSSSRASLTSFSRKSRWTRSRSSVASDARSAFLKTKPVAGNQVLTPAFGTKPVPARNDSCASSRMLKRSCVHPDRARRWCGCFIPSCSPKVH